MTEAIRLLPEEDDAPSPIIGSSAAIRQAEFLARKFAPTNLPILLIGATGTGKELFAQAVHRWSGRAGAMVDLDCGAMPSGMMANELFGHRRGAYTGAVDSVSGFIEKAEGGTLFLDELTSLSVRGQQTLLRVLETREVRRVGESQKRAVDFRLVAAVSDDVWRRLDSGRFRRDLYHRLAAGVIRLPLLVHRSEDVPVLAGHFATHQARTISREGEIVLSGHTWPGNVRELRLVIERACLCSRDTRLTAEALCEAIDAGSPASDHAAGDSLSKSGQPEDRGALESLCRRFGGDAAAIAQALGMSRATLYRRLQAAGIQLNRIAQTEAVARILATN